VDVFGFIGVGWCGSYGVGVLGSIGRGNGKSNDIMYDKIDD
jgi:hypothetical protein